jgi:hypothetical protein
VVLYVVKPPYSKYAMPLIFRCYTDAKGRDVIEDWFHARDGQAQGEIAGVILTLEETPQARRDTTMLKRLEKKSTSKECIGFYEILIDYHDNIHFSLKHHYRILGFLEGDVFTMLYPFYKNNNGHYNVPCRKARGRQVEIAIDGLRSRDCEFPPI